MIWPLAITLAAFVTAIVWLIHLGRQGYDILIDGLFAMMVALILALTAWLIWALRR